MLNYLKSMWSLLSLHEKKEKKWVQVIAFFYTNSSPRKSIGLITYFQSLIYLWLRDFASSDFNCINWVFDFLIYSYIYFLSISYIRFFSYPLFHLTFRSMIVSWEWKDILLLLTVLIKIIIYLKYMINMIIKLI